MLTGYNHSSSQAKQNERLIIKASNHDTFENWLKRNPLMEKVIHCRDFDQLQAIFKSLAERVSTICRDNNEDLDDPAANDNNEAYQVCQLIIQALKRYEYWHLAELLEHESVSRFINPTAKELIMNHIYHIPFDEYSDIEVFEFTQKKYDELIVEHGLPSSINADTLLTYKYHTYKDPVHAEESLAFLNNFSDHVSSLNGNIARCLFTGGHGSRLVLNNLSRDTISEMVGVLKEASVKVDMIVIDCCYSAFHLDLLHTCLTDNGVIFCNYIESNNATFLEALDAEGHNIRKMMISIERALDYNTGIGIYTQKGRTLHILSFNEPQRFTPNFDKHTAYRDYAREPSVLREKAAQIEHALKPFNIQVKKCSLLAMSTLLQCIASELSQPKINKPRNL